MIKTAVILAAGMGSRIRNKTNGHPKGFLVIDKKPIIEHSILKLIAAGITKIYIGTGYMKEDYEHLALKYPQIQCIYNRNYSSTGSLYTLYQFKDYIKEDFLLLESDIIYEQVALESLLENERANIILASQFTHNGDEVYIESNDQNKLVGMSKEQEDLGRVDSELVGITKLSYQAFKLLCSKVINKKMDYENGLVLISNEIPISIHKMEQLVWCEVDDENHWDHAVKMVYPIIKARECVGSAIERKILLNPGPATTTDSVKHAQLVSDICPREEEFGEVMAFISNSLTDFVANTNECTTILFGGSGTAAVESIISSVVDQEFIVIVNNGSYGKRMCKIAEIYHLNYLEYESPVDDAIDIDALESFIQDTPQKKTHLAVVHCETTTGLLNDIEVIGALCKKYGIAMIVDAMSSFAAIPIDMNKMNISFLAASSNKTIQGLAGVSFVVARNDQLEQVRHIRPRNLYLSLYEQYTHFKSTKQMRFTPPVQTLYALKQAIIETRWEGIENRYQRYSKSWETLINGITNLGLTHLIHKDHHSKIITSIIEPSHDHYNFNKMHDYFYKKNITIYPGKLDDLGTFRVSNIGEITYKDIENFISLLELYLIGLDGGVEHNTL